MVSSRKSRTRFPICNPTDSDPDAAETEAGSTDDCPPTRFRYRVSVRTFLLLITLLGMTGGFVGRHLWERHLRRELRAQGTRLTPLEEHDRYTTYEISPGGQLALVVDGASEFAEIQRALDLARHLPRVAGCAIVDPRNPIKLNDLTGLEHLRLLEISGSAEVYGWSRLPELTRLEQLLLLHNPRIGDAEAEFIAGCERLRSLDLSGTSVGDAGAARILEDVPLFELRLRDTRLSAGIFCRLLGDLQLQTLDVSRSRDWYVDRSLRDSDLKVAFDLPPSELRRMMSGERFLGEFRRLGSGTDPPRFDEVSRLRLPDTLEWLDVSGWRFSPVAFASLEKLPALRYLNLSGHQLGSRNVRALAKIPNLERLGLADTNFDDELLRQLGDERGRPLDSLDVRGTAVTSSALQSFSKQPGLKRIHVEIKPQSERQAVAQLRDVLSGLDDMRVLIECFPNHEAPLRTAAGDFPRVRCRFLSSL